MDKEREREIGHALSVSTHPVTCIQRGHDLIQRSWAPIRVNLLEFPYQFLLINIAICADSKLFTNTVSTGVLSVIILIASALIEIASAAFGLEGSLRGVRR